MAFLTLDIETVPQWRFTEPETPVDEKWREEFLAANAAAVAVNLAAQGVKLREDVENGGMGAAVQEDQDCRDIAEALESGEAKLKSTGVQAALHASTAHIISVSWGNSDDGDTQVWQWDDPSDLDPKCTDLQFEADLLERTFKAIATAIRKRRTIVTFNGKGFDLPMLRWRAAILGIEASKLKWDGPGYRGEPAGLLYPFDNETHCDLRDAWTNGKKFAKGTFADMSAAFGIENQEHGADVYEWFKAKEWDRIRSYSHAEAKTLIQLYRACERVL